MIAGELESQLDHFFGKKKGKKSRKPRSQAMRRRRKKNTVRDIQALGGLEGLGRGIAQVGGLLQKRPARPADFQAQLGGTPAPPQNPAVPVAVWVGVGAVVLLLGGVLVYQQIRKPT